MRSSAVAMPVPPSYVIAGTTMANERRRCGNDDKRHRLALTLDDVDRQAAAGGLLVLVFHVRPGLPHGLDRLVQRHMVLAVAPDRHPGRGDRFDRGDGVALDTRDLDQPAHRVTGETEVVLEPDLRR